MSKPDLGRIIAQTMAAPVEGRSIETITDEIRHAQRRGGEAILTIGRCLIEAKEMLPRGEWLPWLGEQVGYSEKTAQNFMRLAREFSNPQALADLGATKALALLALPAEEREKFVEEHNVIDMTTRQLEQAIRERDEARQAAEAADASAAEQARAKMEADMAVVNASLAAAREEKQKADQEAARLEQELTDLKARPVEVAVETVVDQEAIQKARAEAAAEMQAKLDKAREARDRAEAQRKNAEEALEQIRLQLEEQARAELGKEQESPDAGPSEAAAAEKSESVWGWWPETPTESGLYWCITRALATGGGLYWWEVTTKQWEHAGAKGVVLTPDVMLWMACPELPESVRWERLELVDG